jgi:hypothetical protein
MRAFNAAVSISIFACAAVAQVATGGPFTLEKSVVAGGGGAGSGGVFQIGSTTGQALAGGPKTGSPFGSYSGFWVPESEAVPTGPCPNGPGYWKNNPDAWPVDSLTLGDELYTKAELIVLLNTPVGSGKKADASLILTYQLIAAKLNLANGVDAGSLGNAISDADTLLAPYGGKLPYKIVASTVIGQNMVSLASVLEGYNVGSLTPDCAPPT